jgi:GGDEF domain-containing protein
MLGATEHLSELVMNKMAGVADDLRVPEGDCPAVTLSVGIAFSDRSTPTGTLFEDADRALYRVKEMGRNGRRVYGEADAHLPMTEITD